MSPRGSAAAEIEQIIGLDPEAEQDCGRTLGIGLPPDILSDEDKVRRWIGCQAAQYVERRDLDPRAALQDAWAEAEDQADYFDEPAPPRPAALQEADAGDDPDAEFQRASEMDADDDGIPEDVVRDVAGQIREEPGRMLQRDALVEAVGLLAGEYDPGREELEQTVGLLADQVWGDDHAIKARGIVEVALEQTDDQAGNGANGEDAGDDGTRTISVQGREREVPDGLGGWEFTTPQDDPEAGVGHGRTTRARWTRDGGVLAISGRNTNYRLFYWPAGHHNRTGRQTVAGPVAFGDVLARARDAMETGRGLDDPDASGDREGLPSSMNGWEFEPTDFKDARYVGAGGGGRRVEVEEEEVRRDEWEVMVEVQAPAKDEGAWLVAAHSLTSWNAVEDAVLDYLADVSPADAYEAAVAATEERESAAGSGDQGDGGEPGEFVDTRPRQGTLDVGEESRRTADRDPQQAGTDEFVDTRDTGRGESGEQATFGEPAEEREAEGEGLGRFARDQEADDDEDDWAAAVAYLRSQYGDDYGDRVSAGADIGRAVDAPQVLADEGVMQPLLRYQDIPPDDVERQIRSKHPEEADAVLAAVIEFYRQEADAGGGSGNGHDGGGGESSMGQRVPAEALARDVRAAVGDALEDAEECDDVLEAAAAGLDVFVDGQPSPFDDDLDALQDALTDAYQRLDEVSQGMHCARRPLNPVNQKYNRMKRKLESSRLQVRETAAEEAANIRGMTMMPTWTFRAVREHIESHDRPPERIGTGANCAQVFSRFEEFLHSLANITDAADLTSVQQVETANNVKQVANEAALGWFDVMATLGCLDDRDALSAEDFREDWEQVSHAITRRRWDELADELDHLEAMSKRARTPENGGGTGNGDSGRSDGRSAAGEGAAVADVVDRLEEFAVDVDVTRLGNGKIPIDFYFPAPTREGRGEMKSSLTYEPAEGRLTAAALRFGALADRLDPEAVETEFAEEFVPGLDPPKPADRVDAGWRDTEGTPGRRPHMVWNIPDLPPVEFVEFTERAWSAFEDHYSGRFAGQDDTQDQGDSFDAGGFVDDRDQGEDDDDVDVGRNQPTDTEGSPLAVGQRVEHSTGRTGEVVELGFKNVHVDRDEFAGGPTRWPFYTVTVIEDDDEGGEGGPPNPEQSVVQVYADGSLRFYPSFEKTSAEYTSTPARDGYPPDARCGGCAHYIEGGGCHLVRGEISAEAACRFYSDVGVFADNDLEPGVRISSVLEKGGLEDWDVGDVDELQDLVAARLESRERADRGTLAEGDAGAFQRLQAAGDALANRLGLGPDANLGRRDRD